MNRGAELDLLQRRGDEETTTLVGSRASTDMFIAAIRSSGGARRACVQMGRKTLQPRGTMRFGWTQRLRTGELLTIYFEGDGRVSVFGYRVPAGF